MDKVTTILGILDDNKVQCKVCKQYVDEDDQISMTIMGVEYYAAKSGKTTTPPFKIHVCRNCNDIELLYTSFHHVTMPVKTKLWRLWWFIKNHKFSVVIRGLAHLVKYSTRVLWRRYVKTKKCCSRQPDQ